MTWCYLLCGSRNTADYRLQTKAVTLGTLDVLGTPHERDRQRGHDRQQAERQDHDRGRQQAKAIGNWLRAKGLTSARVYSSQWCRCLETAELLEMGPVAQLPALNSFYELTQNREPNLKALNKFIAEQPSEGELIILVTHLVTISAITDQGVSSGEGVLIELKKDAPFEMVGRLDFGES